YGTFAGGGPETFGGATNLAGTVSDQSGQQTDFGAFGPSGGDGGGGGNIAAGDGGFSEGLLGSMWGVARGSRNTQRAPARGGASEGGSTQLASAGGDLSGLFSGMALGGDRSDRGGGAPFGAFQPMGGTPGGEKTYGPGSQLYAAATGEGTMATTPEEESRAE